MTRNRFSIARDTSNVEFSPYDTYQKTFGKEHEVVIEFNYQKQIYKKIINDVYKIFPKEKFKIKEVINYSENDHDYDDYGRMIYVPHVGPYKFGNLLTSTEINLLIHIICFRTNTNCTILCDEKNSDIEKLMNRWQKHIDADDNDPIINIIGHGQGGFTMKPFKFQLPKNDNIEFADRYNDDFIPVVKRIKEKLEIKNGKGIVLLHGIFGSGKTSFLRELITEVPDKKVIYMPSDLTDRISSPDFVTFLISHPNSILFIEDAENALLIREVGKMNAAVSNILNVSDGILGDALHLQIVCTFNCDRSEIDPALLRPGRLIAEYKFDRLTKDKTDNLVKKLYNGKYTPTKSEMTIAEIFNMEEELIISKEKEKVKFGFV